MSENHTKNSAWRDEHKRIEFSVDTWMRSRGIDDDDELKPEDAAELIRDFWNMNVKFIESVEQDAVRRTIKTIQMEIHNLGGTEFVASYEPLIFHPRAIELERLRNYFIGKIQKFNP